MVKEFLRNNLKGDHTLWGIYIALFVISAIEVFSASSTLIYAKATNTFSTPIIQHLIHCFMGFAMVFIVHRIKINRYARFVGGFGWLFCLGWVFIVSRTGEQVNGAARWSSLPIIGIQIQPSEILKLCYIVLIAYIFSCFEPTKENWKKLVIGGGVATVMTFAVIGKDNGSNAILILLTCILIYILAFNMTKTLIVLTLAGIVGLGIGYAFTQTSAWDGLRDTSVMNNSSNRMGTWYNRFDRYVNPKHPGDEGFDEYAKGPGFQEVHSSIAIANSRGIGVGPGRSKERDYLPQAYSDFIYAIIIEETGIFGGAITLFLYLLFLYRVGRIIAKCKSRFAAITAAGLGLILTLQALTNMCVAVGLFPVTGQPLPLVSRGGTSSIIISIYFGILLSISYHECEENSDGAGKKIENNSGAEATGVVEA